MVPEQRLTEIADELEPMEERRAELYAERHRLWVELGLDSDPAMQHKAIATLSRVKPGTVTTFLRKFREKRG